MLLRNKNAIIYGGGGAIGAVAKAFAREDARVWTDATPAPRSAANDQR